MAALIAFLSFPLGISVYLELSLWKQVIWREPVVHGMVEAFCGLMSLILFATVSREALNSGRRSWLLTSFGFLSMGFIDLFHAFSPPGSTEFVWLHSTSAFSGSLFFLVGIFAGPFAERLSPPGGRAVSVQGALALGLILFGALSLLLPYHLPPMRVDVDFTAYSKIINALAAFLFLLAGAIWLRRSLRHRNVFLFAFATALLLFFESEFLFVFSRLWDPTWWLWHIIKVLIFMGIILCGAYAFSEAFHELEQSHVALVRAMKDLEQKNLEVERRSRENADLLEELERAHEKLKATQQTLIESERLASLRELAAGVAHEIRNPLGVLNNSLGVLRRDPGLSREDQELMEIMENEVDRLSEIVTDFLRFARPRPPCLQEVDLQGLIEETLRGFKQDHRLVQVEIVQQTDGTVPCCLLDPNQMKQVLWNVFLNAVQALPDGGKITIGTRIQDGMIEVLVSDTGVGIPSDLIETVFDPFFSTKVEGTGLGLTIVRRIVRAHGGEVTVESGGGGGTTVKIRLPANGLPES